MISKEVESEFNSLVASQKDFFSDHSENVAKYTRCFVERLYKDKPTLNLSKSFIKHVELAALIHDIGKLAIPLDILSKPNTLTEDEYKLIQKHTTYGLNYTKTLFLNCQTKEDYDFIIVCRNVILHHHERLDGSGYVKGIKGKTIPLEARIIAIVDSFDAMTYERCYKQAISKEKAVESLLKEFDKYDEELVKVFIKSLREIKEIRR